MKNLKQFPKKNRFSYLFFKFLCFLLFIFQSTVSYANELNTCTCKDTVDVFVDGSTGFVDLDPALLYDGDGLACNFDSIALGSSGSIINCNRITSIVPIKVNTFFQTNPVDSCESIIRVSGNCACWDANGDGIKQISEDTNLDGVVNFHDCRPCWDLDFDNRADIFEDTNFDGVIDILDCCWDTNRDGFSYPSEDLNNDGVYDSRDCGMGPLVNVQDLITFMDPCACGDPNNCEVGGVTYFHDVMTIPGGGNTISAGLDIRVLSSTDFYIDVPCTGIALSTPNFGVTGTPVVEITPGVYELEFWRPSGIVPTFSVIVDGSSTATAPPSTFEPVCFQEDCIINPIPTMGEWGLIVLGLLILIFGVKALASRTSYATSKT